MMQLGQIAEAVGGQLIGANVIVSGVTTDSRGNCQDELFVALKGERFDAHDFVLQAQHAGAGAALLERTVDGDLPVVLVDDSHQALQALAAWWRAQFVIPMIAVTGSVGKTTVKEMLGSIFSEVGEGLVTKGNLNNEIGLPLTLMRLSSEHQYGIVEMGMNHAGEIERLTNIAKPTIALVNNAAAAHLEGLGTVAAVAKAKGEIFSGLSVDGTAVINADDQYVDVWKDLIGQRNTISFGIRADADVSADFELGQRGLTMQVKARDKEFDVQLATLGKHNVSNALAAIAVATAANISIDLIQAGLRKFRPIDGRLTVNSVAGITIIDDSYNANPASMRAAIEVLAQFDKTILIVGDMAELGDSVEDEHRRLGQIANDHSIDYLYSCGEYAQLVVSDFKGSASAVGTQAELFETLSQQILDQADESNVAILVKGSRAAKMENVVAHISQILKQTMPTSGAIN